MKMLAGCFFGGVFTTLALTAVGYPMWVGWIMAGALGLVLPLDTKRRHRK